VKSTPSLWRHLVFATSWDHHIYGIDKESGKSVWRFATGGMSMSSPSIDASRGLVVAGSNDGNVYGLDARSGKERWRFRTGGPVVSSATLLAHEGVGIIGSSNSMCHVFDLDTGSIHQSLWLYSGLTGVPVAVGRHLDLFDHLGHLYAYTSADASG
jgi:outer membrane protein assembly factor BamB